VAGVTLRKEAARRLTDAGAQAHMVTPNEDGILSFEAAKSVR